MVPRNTSPVCEFPETLANSSYHGGSLRGDYGHGLAADVVSVKGETRSEQFRASEDLWKWIDVHGKDFGVGRPYLDKDPAHVAPIDGKEYAVKRGGAKTQLAGSEAKKTQRVSVRDVPSMTDRAKLSKVRSSEILPKTRPNRADRIE